MGQTRTVDAASGCRIGRGSGPVSSSKQHCLFRNRASHSLIPCPLELIERRAAFYEDVAVLAVPTQVGDHRIADIDEKALYYRSPFSSVEGVKPYLPFNVPVSRAAR